MSELRKYGVLLTTARAISFDLFKVDGIDLEPAATFAAGDIKISKDGGAEANITNLPTDEGQGYRLILTVAELTASRVRISIVDQTATKVWLDISIMVETYGHASAMHTFDLDTALVTLAAATHTGAVIPTVTTLTNKTGFSLAATGLDAIVATAIGMVEIAKAIWDRALTGATHNVATSAGRRLRQIDAAFVITAGTAQAGTANTITLAAAESASDEIFTHDRIVIVGGTGIGEHGIITAYVGATKVATMNQNWVVTPDATSEYEVEPAASVAVVVTDKAGYSISGTKTTLDALNDIAASAIVSAGAITTLAGAIVNVDLVDVTTTNTDMVGTAGANTVVPDAAGVAPTAIEIRQEMDTNSVDLNQIVSDTAAILIDTGTTLDTKINDIQGATFDTLTDSVEAIRNRGDAAWVTGAGGSSPTVVQIRQEMDTNSTELAKLGTPAADISADIAAVKSETALIVADTNELQVDDIPGKIAALNDIAVADVFTGQMAESYAADGVAPTLAQAIFLIQQSIGDFSISGTTITSKKLDGITTAATYTLDDGTNPTSRTRAT